MTSNTPKVPDANANLISSSMLAVEALGLNPKPYTLNPKRVAINVLLWGAKGMDTLRILATETVCIAFLMGP